METIRTRLISVPERFSLAASVGPVRWSGERSPRHAIVDETLISVERVAGDVLQWHITQDKAGVTRIASTHTDGPEDWFHRTFRPIGMDGTRIDPVIDDIARDFLGLYAYTDGSLFTGLVTSIVGQSISLASAAAVQQRLALSFSNGKVVAGQHLTPLPNAYQLAEAPIELLRASGMTWKRAEAIRIAAMEYVKGNLPTDNDARTDRERAISALLSLPMVGPWTAESTLLWGIGDPDAFPTGDVALLRAARTAYDQPGMTMKDLDTLSERWRPLRGSATRVLWAHLLGPGWDNTTGR